MDDLQLVRALKALGDPKRFRMVQEIATAGELSCGQIAERFPIAQPTISHHLKILIDAGLLIMRQDAKHHFISVNRALLDEVQQLFASRLVAPPPVAYRGKRARRPAPKASAKQAKVVKVARRA
ncbi:MAG: metalloregulator ArsR/SmtB family transcription factor [Polyangiaceae bacterium]